MRATRRNLGVPDVVYQAESPVAAEAEVQAAPTVASMRRVDSAEGQSAACAEPHVVFGIQVLRLTHHLESSVGPARTSYSATRRIQVIAPSGWWIRGARRTG